MVSCVAYDADKAVAALIDASVRYGAAYDWIVAYVGCSFPDKVVNKVVTLGLTGFVTAATSSQVRNLFAIVRKDFAKQHHPNP